MTAITTNTSLPGAPLSSQTRANASTDAAATIRNTAAKTDGGTGGTSLDNNGHGPSSTVDLSDRAKAMLERSKVEQAVVEKLADMLAMASDARSSQQLLPMSVDEISQFFQSVTGRMNARSADNAGTMANAADGAKSNVAWENPAPYGDPTISDEAFMAKLNESLLSTADFYDELGRPPEVGQALRDAVKNGTVKVQRASDIPDLNLTSTQTFTPSVNGGGYDSSGGLELHPTGATKDAIEQGRAVAAWHMDRGNIYISW